MLPVLAQYHLFMFDTNLSPDADVTNGQQGCAEFALPMVTPKAEGKFSPDLYSIALQPSQPGQPLG